MKLNLKILIAIILTSMVILSMLIVISNNEKASAPKDTPEFEDENDQIYTYIYYQSVFDMDSEDLIALDRDYCLNGDPNLDTDRFNCYLRRIAVDSDQDTTIKQFRDAISFVLNFHDYENDSNLSGYSFSALVNFTGELCSKEDEFYCQFDDLEFDIDVLEDMVNVNFNDKPYVCSEDFATGDYLNQFEKIGQEYFPNKKIQLQIDGVTQDAIEEDCKIKNIIPLTQV